MSKPKKGDLLYDRAKNRIVVFWSATKTKLRYGTNGGCSQPNSTLYDTMLPIREDDRFTVWLSHGDEVNDYYLTGQQAYELAKEWRADGYAVLVEKINNKE